MPTYEYKCVACGYIMDVDKKDHDPDAIIWCSACGSVADRHYTPIPHVVK